MERRTGDEQLVGGVGPRGHQPAGALELAHEQILPGPGALESGEVGGAPVGAPEQARDLSHDVAGVRRHVSHLGPRAQARVREVSKRLVDHQRRDDRHVRLGERLGGPG